MDNVPSSTDTTNLNIISRYTDQPAAMPTELRDQIQAQWKGQPVQLYALADLDAGMNLVQVWIALGLEQIAVAREGKARSAWDIKSISRKELRELKEMPGLSSTTLSLLGQPGEPALAVFRYTHRQRRAFENIKYILEQQLQGNEI